MAALLRGDQKAMSEAFAKGIQWGWYSVNEVRRLLNLNKIEGGDVRLQPLNMVPLGTPPTSSQGSIDSGVSDMVKRLIDEAANKGTV